MPSLEEAMRQSENGIEHLDDGLITPVNDVFMINPETRVIEVPETERLFGVNFDKDVEKNILNVQRLLGITLTYQNIKFMLCIKKQMRTLQH